VSYVPHMSTFTAGIAARLTTDALPSPGPSTTASPAPDIFGGWPNLNQGLVSSIVGAIIGGFAAAIAAYLVVALTHKRERRLAFELEARRAASEIAAEALTSVTSRHVNRNDLLMSLTDLYSRTMVTVALLRSSMPELAAKLEKTSTEAIEAAPDIHDDQLQEHVRTTSREIYAILTDWLGNG
jgi:hypothetical protein